MDTSWPMLEKWIALDHCILGFYLYTSTTFLTDSSRDILSLSNRKLLPSQRPDPNLFPT